MRNIESLKGCIIGGAVGDALGYPIEFDHIKSIKKRYGSKGITDFELKNGKAIISDDTQMTLFTTVGLIESISNKTACCDNIWDAYTDWYHTQLDFTSYQPKTKLYDIKELHNRRDPGNTCLSALSGNIVGSIENPVNLSKGCGGVMRVAPIGLIDISNEPYINGYLGAMVAALTHGHTLGYMPAGCLADLINRIVNKKSNDNLKDLIIQSIDATTLFFKDKKDIDKFRDIMMTAIALAANAKTDLEGINKIGEGWTGDEALALAIYSCLRHSDDFKQTVICAVNHNGDSDSTGSIAGNIMGTYLGIDAIQNSFDLNKLELYDLMSKLTEELFEI